VTNDTTAYKVPATAVVRVSALTVTPTAPSCGSCGASLAIRRAGTKFCDSRCRKRAKRGMAPAEKPVRRYSTPLAHPTYCVEPCPRCGFPEADGGACKDCGWMLPWPGTPGGWALHPAGTMHGPVYDSRGHRVELCEIAHLTNRPADPAMAA
jgi:hypothetical protein